MSTAARRLRIATTDGTPLFTGTRLLLLGPCYKQIALTITVGFWKRGAALKPRAGVHALSLLSTPLNAQVLEALRDGATPLVDLRRATGSLPPTTMRGHLRRMVETGILERTREAGFPGATAYELTASGDELLGVADELEAWLADAPEGPIEIGTPAARSAVKALIDGWSTGIIRVLAAKPVSLTELSGLITSTSYPSLERRLAAMRLAGQIERRSGGGKGTPYAATSWLRRAIVSLAISIRWERRNLRPRPPVRRTDVEAAFLLIASLLSEVGDLSGSCRFAVEVDTDARSGPRHAGVVLSLVDGAVTSCVTRLAEPADAWASGAVDAWFEAVGEDHLTGLEIGGDRSMVREVIERARTVLSLGVRTV